MSQTRKELASTLQDMLIQVKRPVEGFNVGDYIEWVPGLRNKRHPQYGKFGIICELFDKPIVNPEPDIGSPYFGESIHGRMLVVDDDGDTLEYSVDLTRLRRIQNV